LQETCPPNIRLSTQAGFPHFGSPACPFVQVSFLSLSASDLPIHRQWGRLFIAAFIGNRFIQVLLNARNA
jgi:hypothetical protein